MTESSTGTQPTPTPTEGVREGQGAAPPATPSTEPEEFPYLPPLIRQAIRAFERELPRLREELLAQGYTEKECVAFHGDRYLGHARKQYDLLQKWCNEEGIPEEEIYCHPLMPLVRRVHVLRADIV